jgi:hypothetical protein
MNQHFIGTGGQVEIRNKLEQIQTTKTEERLGFSPFARIRPAAGLESAYPVGLRMISFLPKIAVDWWIRLTFRKKTD